MSTAYNQWTQFESFPEFMSGVESIAQLDDTKPRVMVQIDWEPSGIEEKIGSAVTSTSTA